MRNLETIKKYLPSKKFILIISFIVVLLAGYFLISTIVKKNKAKKAIRQETIERLTGVTVSDLIGKDTDRDGVVDWEESLWGTDKNNRFTFNGIIDSEYINRKKKEINPNFSTLEEENLTETDKFARQFFSSFLALKEGGVDNLTINNFASSVGQNLVNTEIVDEFKKEDIKTSSSLSIEEYYTKMQSTFKKYADLGLGEEMQLLENSLNQYSATGAESSTEKIQTIGIAYQEFAKEASQITTPEIISDTHLNIINSANRTGISVLSFSKVINDPILGVTGLAQYEKNIDDFVKNVTDLETLVSSNNI